MTRRKLQDLIWPDPALPHDIAVFARLSGQAHHDDTGLTLGPGGHAGFDTFANLFNLGHWVAQGPVEGLALDLAGTGEVNLQVRQTMPARPDRTLFDGDLTLTPAGLSVPLASADPAGVVTWALTGRGRAHLTRGALTADPVPGARVRLAIVITTFRREDAVRDTATRITAFLDTDAAGPGDLAGAHLFVIDNGQSVALPAHPRLSLIPNRNLGGAGGFARGLAAARTAGGFSHVLFMDDDAALPLDSLTRTAAFLHHARDPGTALAGAMLDTARPWQMREYGATFDRICRPRHAGTDLRDAEAVLAMELGLPAAPPPHLYGGWWYFTFPLAAVRHDPFPFFVRGDDVSFALSNPFRITVLNGVMSLQDAFASKASPLTAYLDTRYHLHVHVVQPGLRLGPFGTAAVALRQMLFNVLRLHYDSAAAQLLAWEDMLQGPALFTGDIDMARGRARIAALTRTERWQPAADDDPPPDPSPVRAAAWQVALVRATLNGHLLPGARLWGRRVVVPPDRRGTIPPVAWAREAVYHDGAGQAYVVTRSQRRFARLAVRAGWIMLRWVIAWPRLRRQFRDSYDPLTRPDFWTRQFGTFPD